MNRPISQIAREVRTSMLEQSMGYKKPKTVKEAFPWAWPYLEAMLQLDSIEDSYGADSARTVIVYFLCNTQPWRGESARRLKAELQALVKR